MPLRLICAFVLFWTSIAVAPAAGQQVSAPCAPKKEVLDSLRTKFGEVPLIIGLTDSVDGSATTMMILLANETAGSWTLTALAPNGYLCILRSGTDFQSVMKPQKPGRPS